MTSPRYQLVCCKCGWGCDIVPGFIDYWKGKIKEHRQMSCGSCKRNRHFHIVRGKKTKEWKVRVGFGCGVV